MKMKVVPKILKNMVSRPITTRFPHESNPIPDGYRGEHSYDVDKCISCNLCAKICPNKAIDMVEAPEKYKEKYPKKYPRVDIGKCCFCALCEDICPTGAIKLTKNFFLSTFNSSDVIKDPIPAKEVEDRG
ncbi:MAG TPA: NADH-quinone oxidoreductase subunit I [Thermoplasmatales archaeon]|nr:NADH-quinone oxidoreductase subunit I [Thermoplasmatales archaeon]